MSLSRRDFLIRSAAPALLPSLQGAKKNSRLRPNILLIVSDDLAAWMLGCYGNREIRTPNIDTLARAGTRFSFNYVCTPECSASRATLFTGRTPMQHGIEDFLTPQPVANPPQGQQAPPPSFAQEIMISDVLAGIGYNCGYVGRWYMGNDDKPGHGYRYTYTMPGDSSPYQNPVMYLNGERRQEEGYLTELMTRRACDFLDQQKSGKPFFLTASYFNPHTPYTGHPQKYYDMYAKTSFDTIGWQPAAPNALRDKEMMKDVVGNARKCAAATTALDDQIPALLSKLEQRGMRDNTLVIFTSDNGFLLGRHGYWSKGMASNPYNMYEEVAQAPMIWYWPGMIPTEMARPELVSFYDLVPTLCDLTGAPVPDRNLCGHSYLRLVFNQPFPKKHPWSTLVFGHLRNTEMARDDRFKVVIRNNGEGPNEFYDMHSDPGERMNQYENPQFITVRDHLASELEAWKKKYSA